MCMPPSPKADEGSAVSAADVSRREIPFRHEANRLADEIAMFRGSGCQDQKTAGDLVIRSCDLAFNGVVGAGSELAQQLRDWRDLWLGTDEDRDLSRLPHLFVVASSNQHDRVLGRIVHCAVMSHVLMYDESTAGFLAEHWGISVDELKAAWDLANSRRAASLKPNDVQAAGYFHGWDAQSYYAALEDLIRLRLTVFHEPRIELRDGTLWVGPRPVKLAASYAAVIEAALSAPDRRVSKQKLEAFGVNNAALIRQRIVDALKSRGVSADIRTEQGDFVLYSIRLDPRFR